LEVVTVTYPVGAKVVHPCYGAGIIIRIQNKSIGSEIHAYYVIETMSSRAMQLMVPVERASSVGLRAVGELDHLRGILGDCRTLSPNVVEPDLRARQTEMRERMKSGRFGDVAGVVHTLFQLNGRRPLGTVDRQLLDQGLELLAGELALAAGLRIAETIQEVQNCLATPVA
jgi:CarD family transcriptional regulator